MRITALSTVIGDDNFKIAHGAMDKDLTLKAAALELGFVTEAEFDRIVDSTTLVVFCAVCDCISPLEPITSIDCSAPVLKDARFCRQRPQFQASGVGRLAPAMPAARRLAVGA
jgi:hypothetical protein